MDTIQITKEELNAALKDIATEAVKSFIEESGMTKTDQKYIVFPGADEKEILSKSMNERFGILCKALFDRDYVKIEKLKAMSSTSVEGTGIVIPPEVRNEIVDLMFKYGQARQYMRVMSFPENRSEVNMFKAGAGPDVYYPGELGAITPSDLTISTFKLTAKKAAALVTLSNELRDFAVIDFVDYIKNKAAESFAKDEDEKVFGNTNTVFTGLFYGGNTFGYSKSVVDVNSVTYDTLIDLIFGLPSVYLNGASFFMNRVIAANIRKIKDNNGQPIFDSGNGSSLPTLLGYPVRLIETAPNTAATGEPFIILGNLNNSYLFEKKAMTIDVSSDAVVGSVNSFTQDATSIRFIRHWGFHPGNLETYASIEVT